jgi:hypothetical protein
LLGIGAFSGNLTRNSTSLWKATMSSMNGSLITTPLRGFPGSGELKELSMTVATATSTV